MSQNYQIEFKKLVRIVTRLRAPQGCPWDRQQTHRSLREFLLEECYEALAALDEGNVQKLRQELGDLLLQILLHSQIAEENKEFSLEDVLSEIGQKLIRRHPHVFGTTAVQNAAEVAHNWEQIKKGERQPGASILESIPAQLPALAYGQDMQRRAAQSGFDWENTEGVIEKLVEEVREFEGASGQAEKEEEFGDLLFTLVNLARRLGIDSESALREADRKFFHRFSYMESLCRERGLSLEKLSPDEQNGLWEEAKRAVTRQPPKAPLV